jgi:hypothetical protein
MHVLLDLFVQKILNPEDIKNSVNVTIKGLDITEVCME